jgi:RND family efflux transporter MFP subunit
MIPEGQVVEQATVVARFDATELEDRLREHHAKLETVLQEKEKEQRNLEVALREMRLELVRAEGELKTVELDLSVPEGLVATIDIEQARLQRDLARRRVAFLTEKIEFEKDLVRAKLELLDVKAEYERGKIAYNESAKEKFNVKAPVSGLVVYIPKRNGDRWEIGEGVWMLAKFLKIADVTTLQVEANVLEVDASRITPGQKGEISVDAVPGLILESEVAEVGKLVRERSVQDPSKVFDAILPLGDVDTEQLRPGMGVQVRIRTELLPDQLTIPVEAVHSSASGTWVELVGSGGDIERREVQLGERAGDRVVVEQGLSEGNVVRVAGDRA